MGPVVGAVIGQTLARGPAPAALVASSTVLAYRTLSALLFRDQQISLLADRVSAADLPFVVPRPARSKYVGSGYVRRWPRELGARYTAAAPDAGKSRPPWTRWWTARRPRAGRPAGPGVLRAHHAVRPGHRPGVAAVGQARLPAVPHRRRAPLGPGQYPDEPTRGSARDSQPHRHGQRRRRRGICARLDQVVRRRRRANHGRHLHHLGLTRARLATSASGSQYRGAASPPRCSRDHALVVA